MKLFALALCVVACAAAPASLDNTYLPPGSARSSGGNGNFLATPHNGAGGHGGGGSYNGAGGHGGGGSYNGAGGHGGGGSYNGASARSPDADTPILRLDSDNNGDGSYHYAYETGNGIQAEEAAQLKGAESIEVRGSYSYTGDDGQQYTVTYIADENGFQPQGAHLPTPPPIPEAILRSLEQNAADGNSGDDGSYNEAAHGGGQAQGGYGRGGQGQGGHGQGGHGQGGHGQGGRQSGSNSNAGYHY